MESAAQRAWESFRADPSDANFAPLYETSKALVYTIAVRILASEEDARDAFQSTYGRLLCVARGEEPELHDSEFPKLIARLARREADALRKRRGRRQRKEIAVTGSANQGEGGPNPRRAAADAQLRDRVETLVSLLPDRQRVPVFLHYFHGMTYAEIAETLGKSPGTIAYRIDRGLKRLAPMMRRAGLGDSALALGTLLGAAELALPPSSLEAAAVLAGAKAAGAAAASAGVGSAVGKTVLGVLTMKTKLTVATGLIALTLIGFVYFGVMRGIGDRPGSASSSSAPEALASEEPAPGADGSVAPPETQTVSERDDGAEPPSEVASRAAPAQGDAGPAASQDTAADTAVGGEPATRIFGRVLLADNESPIEGAEVSAGSMENFRLAAVSTITDAQGAFEIQSLNPGNYILWARSGNLISPEMRFRDFRRPQEGRNVFLSAETGAAGPVTLYVKAGRRLHLLVRSGIDNEPLAGASVTLFDNTEKFTESNGMVAFEGLTPEEWSLTARAPGHARTRKVFSLVGQTDSIFEMTLPAGGVIYGIVSDSADQPLSDVGVGRFLSSDGDLAYPYLSTDEEGGYRIDGLAMDRNLSLAFAKEGYESQVRRSNVKIPSSEGVLELNVQLSETTEPQGAIEGIVVDTRQSPVQAARVVYGYRSMIQKETQTGSDGRFRLEKLADDPSYNDILVEAKNYGAKRVRIRPGTMREPEQITIELEDGHSVKGTVVNEIGEAVGGVRITPQSAQVAPRGFSRYSIEGKRQVTGPDGRFEFDSLPSDVVFGLQATGYTSMRDQVFELDGDDIEVVILGEGILAGTVVDAESGEPVERFKIKTWGSNDVRADEPRVGYPPSGLPPAEFDSPDGFFRLDGLVARAPLVVRIEAEGYAAQAFDRVIVQTELNFEPIELELSKNGIDLRGVVVDTQGTPLEGVGVAALVYPAAERVEPMWRSGSIWNVLDPSTGTHTDWIADFRRATTDASGTFSFPNLNPNHPIDVVAGGGGYTGNHLKAIETMADAERENLVITLGRGGRVYGRLNREIYSDSNSVSLSTRGENAVYLSHRFEGASDAFDFEEIPAGKVWLTVQGRPEPFVGPGGPMAIPTVASVEFDLPDGEDKEVNIGFGAMFRVGGRAIYSGGPLADGRVFLVTPGVYGRSRRRTSTDLEGNFLFENVEARDYEVLAFRDEPDFSALLQTADRVPIVVVDEDVVRDFEFAGSGSMTGRIVNLPSGDWSWRLTLYAEDTSALPPEFLEAARGRQHADGTTPIRESMLPTDGSFRFSALRPGRHTLEIHAGMVGVEEETRRTIMSDVFMPPDRGDLDLGEIELAE